MPQTIDLFEPGGSPWRHLLPRKQEVAGEAIHTSVWDIPYTIPQLSYATHGHFRYYGKFPSSVAAQILEDHPPSRAGDYVLDNFCGSGTTLVEARLRGIRSYGVDVSWLAVLASNVKTAWVDLDKVQRLSRLVAGAPSDPAFVTDRFTEKWFEPAAAAQLSGMRNVLLSLPRDAEADFLVLAFLGIIRRVSRAYDGEVRPHINKAKKVRDPGQAFAKKVRDMIEGHKDFQSHASRSVDAQAFLADNRSLPQQFSDGGCYLVVSHPPYLNSFDYSPVFNMEYYWGECFAPSDNGKISAKSTELKAYPAKPSLVEAYYKHLELCYAETARIQRSGALLAIVIGDCTRNGLLEPVIENTVSSVLTLGYELTERNYRTTHYGLGKYAYNHRADYHGEAEKRDGVFVFRKT